jgi:hypothetical protein
VSFRELDKGLVKRQSPPQHWTQRWLRVIFIEDWGTKLLALVISLALWYGVDGTAQADHDSRASRASQLPPAERHGD